MRERELNGNKGEMKSTSEKGGGEKKNEKRQKTKSEMMRKANSEHSKNKKRPAYSSFMQTLYFIIYCIHAHIDSNSGSLTHTHYV